jgi:hypothetical protein
MNVRPLDMLKEMVDVLLNEYDVNVQDKRRLESVVVPRSALFNVCRGYYSATTLGKYFGKNHATILHHFKNHDSLMLVPQYREYFERLTEVLIKYDERARTHRNNMILEMESLRDEVEQLKEKLIEYETAHS